jgi:hypothetical protein
MFEIVFVFFLVFAFAIVLFIFFAHVVIQFIQLIAHIVIFLLAHPLGWVILISLFLLSVIYLLQSPLL